MAVKTKAEKIAEAEARRKTRAEAAANPPSPPGVAVGPKVDPDKPLAEPIPSPPTVATGPVNGEPDPKVQAHLDEQQKALDDAKAKAEPEPEPKTKTEKRAAEKAEQDAEVTRAQGHYSGSIAVGPTGGQQVDPKVLAYLDARQAEIDKGRTDAELDAEISAAHAAIEDEAERQEAKRIVREGRIERDRRLRNAEGREVVDETPKLHGRVDDLKAPY